MIKFPTGYSKILSSGYNHRLNPERRQRKGKNIPTVKDIVVRKPSADEEAACKTWPIWTCKPSIFDWAYTQTETCLIIDGKVTVTDGKDSVSFGPGDLVIFPVDLECTWHVKKPVKKHYNFK